jgi:glycosyltransferase involved in cell wall biosynthesis
VKKVLFITNIPVPYRVDFYNALGQYCELTVIFEARRIGNQKFNWKDDNIRHFKPIFLTNGDFHAWKINIKVLAYLYNIKWDLIFVTNYAYATESLALFFLKLVGIPYFYETDGAYIKKEESKLRFLLKSFFLKGAKVYMSPSNIADEYFRYYATKHIVIHRYPFTSIAEDDILPDPISPEYKLELRNALGIKEKHVLLAVGQFIPRKGFDVLMRATHGMDKGIGIYIVGGEPSEEYLLLQDQLGLTNVHFVGFKTKKELSQYFKAADLFVHPTREDIWGLVINEAMAVGLPIITTNKCLAGIELLQDKRCIVEADNVPQLHSAICELINDSETLRQLSIQNLDKIANYTIEKMVEAHLKVINQ